MHIFAIMNKWNLRNYINACSNGELEKVIQLLSIEPGLINKSNRHGYKGTYYAFKNLRYDVAHFLLSKGCKISKQEIINIIRYHWRASLESFIFLNKFKSFELIEDFDNQVFNLFKNSCFDQNKVNKVINILEYQGKNNRENLILILNEYKSAKKNSTNPAYIQSIRDLQLNLLIN